MQTMKYMAKIAVPALICLLFCIQTAGAQGASVRLAYRFAPGETTRYLVNMRAVGDEVVEGIPTPRHYDIEMSSIVRVRCLESLASGKYKVAVDIESGSLKSDGKTAEGYTASTNVKTFIITSDGRFAPEKEGGPALSFGSVESMVFLTVFPSEPISIGSSWEDDIPLPQNPSIKVKLVYSLVDIRQRVASIQQKISTPIASGISKGSQSGNSNVRIDLDSGKLISSSGTGRSVIMGIINVSSGANAQNTKPSVSTLTLDTKYSVDRLP